MAHYPIDSAIPPIFCWSKVGPEAGQTLGTIIRRKELERRAGDGVFAWGIGNSLGNNVEVARQMSLGGDVDVLFTPMKSAPKLADIAPREVLLWLSYIARNGCIAPLPEHLLITSRGDKAKRVHYALLCHSENSIELEMAESYIYATRARNIVSSNRVGPSQVTAVVRYATEADPVSEAPYKVAFRATLHLQGFLKLVNPVCLQGDLTKKYNQACAAKTPTEWRALAAETRRLADERSIPSEGRDLFA